MLNRNSLLKGAVVFAATVMASEAAFAACGATINGRPMTVQECNLGISVYGSVVPGTYAMDGFGNWVHYETGARGNTYRDARRQPRARNRSRYACGGTGSIFAQGEGATCGGQRRSIFGQWRD